MCQTWYFYIFCHHKPFQIFNFEQEDIFQSGASIGCFDLVVLKAHVQLMEDGGSGVSTQSAGASWVRLVEKGLGSELGPATHQSQDMGADTV